MVTSRAARLPKPFTEWWIYFVVAFGLAFIGFWPSFFSALSTTKAPHLIHGFSATAWMLLPILQAWMIKTRRRAWHRTIGWASLALAPVVVLSALRILQLFALRNVADFQVRRFKFEFLDMTGIFLFCVFLALAIQAARKRDFPLHLRLIACTALIPLEAAVERLLVNSVPCWVPNFEVALQGALIFMELTLVVIIAGELFWRRLRWPFPFLLAYYVVMHVTVSPVANSPAFQTFTMNFARLGG